MILEAPGWNWRKFTQKLSDILRLNFRCFKIICFLHPPCHPKIIGDVLNNGQIRCRLFQWRYMINEMKMRLKMKYR